MDLIVAETSALPSLEPLLVNLNARFSVTLSPFVPEEIEGLRGHQIHEDLDRLMTDLSLTPKDPETPKLTDKLVKLLGLPSGLVRHLAQAQAIKAAALITLDPRLLALPVSLTLSRQEDPWPLIAHPESLSWPKLWEFSRWFKTVTDEVARETQDLTLSQKELLAQKWRNSPPISELDEAFDDPLTPLNPDPASDFCAFLNQYRQRVL